MYTFPMDRKYIQENYGDSELILLEPEYFDEAIMGVITLVNMPHAVCYNREKCIELLMEHEEMSEEDAVDYFEYNTSGFYVGKHTPVFLDLQTTE
jgi:hypothetical protein